MSLYKDPQDDLTSSKSNTSKADEEIWTDQSLISKIKNTILQPKKAVKQPTQTPTLTPTPTATTSNTTQKKSIIKKPTSKNVESSKKLVSPAPPKTSVGSEVRVINVSSNFKVLKKRSQPEASEKVQIKKKVQKSDPTATKIEPKTATSQKPISNPVKKILKTQNPLPPKMNPPAPPAPPKLKTSIPNKPPSSTKPTSSKHVEIKKENIKQED